MSATFWTNSDGLVIRMSGVVDAADNVATTVKTTGEVKQIVIPISDATSIDASAAPTNLTQGAWIPAGSLVTSVKVFVDAEFTSGGAAVLEVGSYDSNGTVIDKDQFASVALGSLTADTVVVEDTIPDASIAVKSYIGVTYGTAAYTAGSGKVVIEYVKQ